jgi:hypothetical protein
MIEKRCQEKMQPEIINLYITRLLKEIDELNKNRFLIETQLQYTEGLNSNLQKKVSELELQIEKNKKINKKEIDTSTF